MTGEAAEFEALLRRALAPVDPPEDLSERLETTLASLREMAVDELEAWELSAMRDPRNWVRPAAAVVVGGTAGTALFLLRARRRQQRRVVDAGGVRALAERTLRDIAADARRILDER